MVALLCGATAIVAKEYGDGNLDDIPDHHHLSECTNNANSDAIEDVVHSLWHVFSALAFLLFLDIKNTDSSQADMPTSKELAGFTAMTIVFAALAVIVTASVNTDTYWAWLLVAFVTSFACFAIDVYAHIPTLILKPTKYRAMF